MSNTRTTPRGPAILYLTIASWCLLILLALGGIGILYQVVKAAALLATR